jgi:16S rRNA (guanine(966)-N(2))-methyltransferase RsmD
MRIITGKYGGRRFEGKLPNVTRPTTDYTKETIFNILMNYIDFEDIVAADLCSGAGSLGIEALSRGARKCFFFEKNRKAMDYFLGIIQKFGIPKSEYTLIGGDAIGKMHTLAEDHPDLRIDLALTDPPYAKNMTQKILDNFDESGLAADEAIFAAEHGTAETAEPPDGWELLTSRAKGETVIEVFAKRG